MGRMNSRWFSGRGAGPEEDAVLGALRGLVESDGLPNVRREDTQASTRDDWPLVLSIQVPELRSARGAPGLQVGVVFDDDQVQILGGWETHGFVLDSRVDVLDLSPAREPRGVAAAVPGWIVTPLARPMVQDEWTTSNGTVRRAWRFADDSSQIEGDRGTGRLARRRPPDRIVRLR